MPRQKRVLSRGTSKRPRQDLRPDVSAHERISRARPKWPILIDDGYVSPPEPDPAPTIVPPVVNRKKAAQALYSRLRTRLAKEISQQLPILKAELNRKNRMQFLEFCARYGLGSMQANVRVDGSDAETVPPGKLTPAEIQQHVVMFLQSRGKLAAAQPADAIEVTPHVLPARD